MGDGLVPGDDGPVPGGDDPVPRGDSLGDLPLGGQSALSPIRELERREHAIDPDHKAGELIPPAGGTEGLGQADQAAPGGGDLGRRGGGGRSYRNKKKDGGSHDPGGEGDGCRDDYTH